MFTDAESPSVRNFIANYRGMFCVLHKKMILLKKK